MKRGKVVVWESFLTEERREVKGKGERERYIQQNPEFKRIARRVKKTFFNEQCKEIEENNRKRKTRDLFKKTGNMKGTFQGRMGTIKDRNSKDLMEAEEIKKKWQEYTDVCEVAQSCLTLCEPMDCKPPGSSIHGIFQNTQKNCTKKDLNDPDNHYGVVIYLESDFLECEDKWVLESITTNKASGDDGIPNPSSNSNPKRRSC